MIAFNLEMFSGWRSASIALSRALRASSGECNALPPDQQMMEGALFLNVLMGMVDWSQYGSASRKFCFLLKRPLIVLRRPISALLARTTFGLAICEPGARKAALPARKYSILCLSDEVRC